MKKIVAVLLLASVILCSTGCNGDNSSGSTSESLNSNSSENETTADIKTPDISETTAGESDTTSLDVSNMTEEEIYNAMVERSLMSTGDISRMAKALAKAEKGEEITVAYIGGSITEGLTAGADACYAKLSYNWLCEKYPDAKINFVNAGVSGTPSILGDLRVQRDVLDKKPDIVFIEFAVNDGQEAEYKECFESMVKTILSEEQQPAVALLFTVLKNGYTCQEHMSKVGENYDLPMVSITNALQPEFDGERLTWEKYSDDESHPNVWGHQMVTDLISNMYTKIIDKMKDIDTSNITIPAINDKTVFGDKYMDMKLLDSLNTEVTSTGSWVERSVSDLFPNDWVYSKKAGTNAPLEFKFTGKNLFLVYRCSKTGGNGSVTVTVDGEKTADVAGSAPDGWNNPVAQLVYSSEEVKEHTVQIMMSEGDEEKMFIVLALGYN